MRVVWQTAALSHWLKVLDNPGIVGGLILPVLGALPDVAIIVASSLGDTAEEAQQEACNQYL